MQMEISYGDYYATRGGDDAPRFRRKRLRECRLLPTRSAALREIRSTHNNA